MLALVRRSFYEREIAGKSFPWVGNQRLVFGKNAIIKREAGQDIRFSPNLEFGVTSLAVLPCVFGGQHPILVQCLLVDDLFPAQPGVAGHIKAVFGREVLSALKATYSSIDRDIVYTFQNKRSFVKLRNVTLDVHVDGACLNNGQENPAAGVGLYFGPNSCFNQPSTYHNALTDWSMKGSQYEVGEGVLQKKVSSQRAEIVSTLLAIFRCWKLRETRGYYFRRLRINTDSQYVVNAFNDWIPNKWLHNDWMNAKGKPVENEDLFQVLWRVATDMGDEEVLSDPVAVIIRHVPRTENSEADKLAKAGAEAARVQGQVPKASDILPVTGPVASSPGAACILEVDAAHCMVMGVPRCIEIVDASMA